MCGHIQGGSSWSLGLIYALLAGTFMLAVGIVLWASITLSMSSFHVKASLKAVEEGDSDKGLRGTRPVTLSSRVSVGIEKIAAILRNRRNVKVGKKVIRGEGTIWLLCCADLTLLTLSYMHVVWTDKHCSCHNL